MSYNNITTCSDVGHTQHEHISYAEAQTLALVGYAHSTPAHKHAMVDTVKNRFPGNYTVTRDSVSNSEDLLLLTPATKKEAERRFEWLLNSIEDESLPHTQEARALLTTWAAHPEDEPKNLVIGIVGLAIPGPTLGIIKRKKIHNSLHVVVSKQFLLGMQDIEMTQKTAQLTAEICKQELIRSGKNAQRMNPDMADWFFGEKPMTFYTADKRIIEDIAGTLGRLGINHRAAYDRNEDITILAMSPEVNSDALETRWELESLEDEADIR